MLDNYYGMYLYKYNSDGIRISKTYRYTNKTTRYMLDGERIIAEYDGTSYKKFFYDESGIAGMIYNGNKYYFFKNLQGDVVGVCNQGGSLVGTYDYDAWGNILNSVTNDVLKANPFRYRGYYYDSETGLYYLNSRYYDPEIGRFISPDEISYLEPETLGGLNLYAYCNNNPVMFSDPSGHEWWKFWEWDWSAIGTITVIAATAICGALLIASPLSGLLVSVISGALLGFATSATSNLITQVIQKGWDNINYGEVWKEGGIGAAIGAVSGVFSFKFAEMAKAVGSYIGYTFSNTVHIGTGITFGKVFGRKMLMAIGSGAGSVVGTIFGATVGDYFGNKMFGMEYSLSEKLDEVIRNELPGFAKDFLMWIL